MPNKGKKRSVWTSLFNRRSKKRGRKSLGARILTAPTGLNRRQIILIAGLLAVIGVAIIVVGRADSSPTCTSLNSSGSTVKYCLVSAPGYNALLATADYVASDTNSLMTSATLSLKTCSPQTGECTAVDTSNQLRLYNANQPRYQRLYTHGITFLRGANYKVCLDMTTAQGWNLTSSCTATYDYGMSVGNTPHVYALAGRQPNAAMASRLGPSPDCNEPGIKKADGSSWKCSFDDEFSGGTLDSTKWSPLLTANTRFANSPDCYVSTPQNISVSDGALSLSSVKQPAPFACRAPGGRSYTSQVTSGTVSTYQKFTQQYGRFEIRAKVPSATTPGLEESFWLWPDKPFDQDPANAPWPAIGEIDIVEMYHSHADRAIPFIHYAPASNDTEVTNNYCYIDVTQYHNYTLTWTPDTIQIDVDGYNCVTDHPKPASPQANPQPFNKPFFLTLTSGLGVNANPNSYVDGVTPLPATTQVDYVRIWQ